MLSTCWTLTNEAAGFSKSKCCPWKKGRPNESRTFIESQKFITQICEILLITLILKLEVKVSDDSLELFRKLRLGRWCLVLTVSFS